MNLALLTDALNHAKNAYTAVGEGKKFTALDEGGQAVSLVGKFGAESLEADGPDGIKATADGRHTDKAEAVIECEAIVSECDGASPDEQIRHLLKNADIKVRECQSARGGSDSPEAVKARGDIARRLLEAALTKLLPLIFNLLV